MLPGLIIECPTESQLVFYKKVIYSSHTQELDPTRNIIPQIPSDFERSRGMLPQVKCRNSRTMKWKSAMGLIKAASGHIASLAAWSLAH